MWLLAALASLLFPGAGHALAREIRRGVLWAVAGFLPIVAILWFPQGMLVAIAVRVACAVDAWIVVRRAAPDTRNYYPAGAVAIATGVVLLGVRLLALESVVPQSTSMTPTLTIGDRVFIDKLTPRFTGYHRGEIVVFDHPIHPVQYLKRIAAVGGDTVAVRDGILYVNGVAQAQKEIGNVSYWDMNERTWTQHDAVAYREDLAGHVHTVFRYHRLPSEKYVMSDYPVPGTPEGEDPCGGRAASTARANPAPPMQLTADRAACTVPAGTFFVLGDNRDNSNDSRAWGALPAANVFGRVVGIWWSSNDKTGTEPSRIGRVD
jgi:signal peptidase I